MEKNERQLYDMMMQMLTDGKTMDDIGEMVTNLMNQVDDDYSAATAKKEQMDKEQRPWAYGTSNLAHYIPKIQNDTLTIAEASQILLAAYIQHYPIVKEYFTAESGNSTCEAIEKDLVDTANTINKINTMDFDSFIDELFKELF